MGIWSRAPEPGRLYEGLAMALASSLTDLRSVRPVASRTVQASASDPEALAVSFLSKVLLLFHTEGFVGRRVAVTWRAGPPPSLEATLEGEPFDPGRHPQRIEVKAITMHRAKVDLVRGIARLVVDI